MASPFDELIGIKSENPAGSNANSNKDMAMPSKIDKGKPLNEKKAHGKAIIVERTLYYIIIIALVSLIITNPFQNKNDCIKNTNGNQLIGAVVAAPITLEKRPEPVKTSTIPEQNQTTQTTITISRENQEDIVIQKNESVKIEVKTMEKEIEKPFIINFDLKIESVDYEKNVEGNPSKMKSVSVSLWNRWKTFQPRIEIYWYDKDSSDAIKQKKRAISTFKLEKGPLKVYKFDTFDSKFFDPTNREEIVEIKLFDSSNNIFLTSKTYKVS